MTARLWAAHNLAGAFATEKEKGYTLVTRFRRSLGRLLAHRRLAKNQREPVARSAR